MTACSCAISDLPTCNRPLPGIVTGVALRNTFVRFGFDEVVVTTFTSGAGTQTLPQWILNNFSRPNVLPYVTVVATIVMVISLPIAWLAQRLSDGPSDR